MSYESEDEGSDVERMFAASAGFWLMRGRGRNLRVDDAGGIIFRHGYGLTSLEEGGGAVN